MSCAVRFDVHPGVAHLAELFPAHRFASAKFPALDPLGVNEQRERISELLQNRPRDLVAGFVTIIDRDDRAPRRNRFFAALPGEKILHPNYRDALVFEFLHLRLESLWRDLG